MMLHSVVVSPRQPELLSMFLYLCSHTKRQNGFVYDSSSCSSVSDVKRLAEKEDWVVDNEGITSLVRMLILFRMIQSSGKSSVMSDTRH